MLTTDPSEHSISGILLQEGHPVTYSSRRLTNTEFNYSNIEKEALAIVWTTTRARFFRMAWSNQYARQEKFYDKTDS